MTWKRMCMHNKNISLFHLKQKTIRRKSGWENDIMECLTSKTEYTTKTIIYTTLCTHPYMFIVFVIKTTNFHVMCPIVAEPTCKKLFRMKVQRKYKQ